MAAVQAGLEVQLGARAGQPQRRQAGHGQAVDARERRTALPRQQLARAGQCRVAHDAPAQRLAFQAFHHEALAGPVLGPQHMAHGRHRHAGRVRRRDQRGLGREARATVAAPTGSMLRMGGVGRAAQHQRRRAGAGADLEGPGLLARTARQAAQPRDRPTACGQPAGQCLQRVEQPLLVIQHGRSAHGPCAAAPPRRPAWRT